jgi:hypothetical protein
MKSMATRTGKAEAFIEIPSSRKRGGGGFFRLLRDLSAAAGAERLPGGEGDVVADEVHRAAREER